jgi:anti-sigma factor RsiW
MTAMQCAEAQQTLGAMIDGETSAIDEAARAHVANCPRCAQRCDDYRDIGAKLRAVAYQSVPPGLEGNVLARLAAETLPNRDSSWLRPRGWLAQAAALVIVAGLSSLVSWQLGDSRARHNMLERDVVSAHARSLLQESPVQVASSQSHTVKPWFNGRIEFAPSVKDLTDKGFPLVGGRVDVVVGQRVATLVYKRRLHVINVFIWPSADSTSPGPTPGAVQGYNTVSWSAGGLTYWAISDLNARELAELQGLL